MDAQVKLAVAMSILRARSQSVNDVQHWKKKAKERKNKLAKLKHDLKEIQDDMLSKMLPQVASCKCNFFENFDKSSLEGQAGNEERDTYSINQVLFRQFLRQVHLTKRLKNHKDSSAGCHLPNGPSVEDEKEKLASATNFLLEIIDMQSPAYSKQLFATYSHQAVDFIKDTLQVLLTIEEADKFIVGLVNNLAMHLVERIYCTSKYDGLDSASHDKQFHVQHIMHKLGAVPFIGQRMLLAASQSIASLADSLLCMGPFDSTITQLHNCMFIMIT
jgi:hypothetical protein